MVVVGGRARKGREQGAAGARACRAGKAGKHADKQSGSSAAGRPSKQQASHCPLKHALPPCRVSHLLGEVVQVGVGVVHQLGGGVVPYLLHHLGVRSLAVQADGAVGGPRNHRHAPPTVIVVRAMVGGGWVGSAAGRCWQRLASSSAKPSCPLQSSAEQNAAQPLHVSQLHTPPCPHLSHPNHPSYTHTRPTHRPHLSLVYSMTLRIS